MSKYSNEFKLEVVKYCIKEHRSKYNASKKINIPAHSTIYQWIKRYQEHGIAGLIKNI